MLFAVVVLLLSDSVQSAPIYQCRDEKGKVTISDIACPTGSTTEKISQQELPAERAAAAKSKTFGNAVQPILCKSHQDAMRNMDAALLDAFKRRDTAAQQRLYEQRRRYGNVLRENGC